MNIKMHNFNETYIIESFFDDIDDINDTNDNLHSTNVDNATEFIVLKIYEILQDLQTFSYSYDYDTETLNLSTIYIKNSKDVDMFAEILKLLRNIGCKCINISDYASFSVKDSIIRKYINFYNIHLNVSTTLLLYDITPKNLLCKSDIIKISNCDFSYNSSISLTADIVEITNCMNMSDFSFISYIGSIFMYNVSNSEQFPKTGNMTGLPTNSDYRIEILIKSRTDNSQYNSVMTLKGIPEKHHTQLACYGYDGLNLANAVSAISLSGISGSDYLTIVLSAILVKYTVKFGDITVKPNISSYTVPNDIIEYVIDNKINKFKIIYD